MLKLPKNWKIAKWDSILDWCLLMLDHVTPVPGGNHMHSVTKRPLIRSYDFVIIRIK